MEVIVPVLSGLLYTHNKDWISPNISIKYGWNKYHNTIDRGLTKRVHPIYNTVPPKDTSMNFKITTRHLILKEFWDGDKVEMDLCKYAGRLISNYENPLTPSPFGGLQKQRKDVIQNNLSNDTPKLRHHHHTEKSTYILSSSVVYNSDGLKSRWSRGHKKYSIQFWWFKFWMIKRPREVKLLYKYLEIPSNNQ